MKQLIFHNGIPHLAEGNLTLLRDVPAGKTIGFLSPEWIIGKSTTPILIEKTSLVIAALEEYEYRDVTGIGLKSNYGLFYKQGGEIHLPDITEVIVLS